MELKRSKLVRIISKSVVLIVPYGIETQGGRGGYPFLQPS